MAKKDPFPNNWQDVFELDDDDFESPPFIHVWEDSVVWELPDPFICVIRSYNRKDNQLKEYAYKRESVAQAKIMELATQGDELTILTQQFIGTINYSSDDDS
jgi:hypothetical protein